MALQALPGTSAEAYSYLTIGTGVFYPGGESAELEDSDFVACFTSLVALCSPYRGGHGGEGHIYTYIHLSIDGCARRTRIPPCARPSTFWAAGSSRIGSTKRGRRRRTQRPRCSL